MNCKPGDMAIVVVPADWPCKTIDGLIVEVIRFMPPNGLGAEWDQRPTWWCTWKAAWVNCHGRMLFEGGLLDSWLRPISGVPVADDVEDEVIA